MNPPGAPIYGSPPRRDANAERGVTVSPTEQTARSGKPFVHGKIILNKCFF
jgi:hypothetical protein